MEEGILNHIVHVVTDRQKPRSNEKSGGNCRLQCQSATVVSYFAHGPKQRQGKTDVKARKQPRPERYAGIPHIVRSADEKSPGEEPPADVSGPKDSRRQRTDRLTGNQQRVSPPQTCAG